MALECNSFGDKKNEKGGLWVLPQLGYRGLGPCWGVQGGKAPRPKLNFSVWKSSKMASPGFKNWHLITLQKHTIWSKFNIWKCKKTSGFKISPLLSPTFIFRKGVFLNIYQFKNKRKLMFHYEDFIVNCLYYKTWSSIIRSKSKNTKWTSVVLSVCIFHWPGPDLGLQKGWGVHYSFRYFMPPECDCVV